MVDGNDRNAPTRILRQLGNAADRLHVAGTKRGGRVRDIPLAHVPAVAPLSRDRFEKLFRKRMEGRITPYDLRRT